MSGNLPDLSRRRPRPRLLVWFVLGLSGLLLTLAYVPALPDKLETLLIRQFPDAPRPPASPDRAFDAPGIVRPPTVAADKAALDDDTPVIGVSAGAVDRAYLIEAFENGPMAHVVNDVLGAVPVSVTHCNISGCTSVFTGDTRGQPLELSLAGLKDYRLVLKAGGRPYRQETCEPLSEGSPPFPYARYPAEITTWGVWRQRHPDTDVYMGPIDEATGTDPDRGASQFAPPTASP
jgi:hypothetical protein